MIGKSCGAPVSGCCRPPVGGVGVCHPVAPQLDQTPATNIMILAIIGNPGRHRMIVPRIL